LRVVFFAAGDAFLALVFLRAGFLAVAFCFGAALRVAFLRVLVVFFFVVRAAVLRDVVFLRAAIRFLSPWLSRA